MPLKTVSLHPALALSLSKCSRLMDQEVENRPVPFLLDFMPIWARPQVQSKLRKELALVANATKSQEPGD